MGDQSVEGILSWADAYDIGEKITEMADRVKVMHAACPGAQAKWGFELDGVRFKVVVAVDPSGEGSLPVEGDRNGRQ